MTAQKIQQVERGLSGAIMPCSPAPSPYIAPEFVDSLPVLGSDGLPVLWFWDADPSPAPPPPEA